MVFIEICECARYHSKMSADSKLLADKCLCNRLSKIMGLSNLTGYTLNVRHVFHDFDGVNLGCMDESI